MKNQSLNIIRCVCVCMYILHILRLYTCTYVYHMLIAPIFHLEHFYNIVTHTHTDTKSILLNGILQTIDVRFSINEVWAHVLFQFSCFNASDMININLMRHKMELTKKISCWLCFTFALKIVICILNMKLIRDTCNMCLNKKCLRKILLYVPRIFEFIWNMVNIRVILFVHIHRACDSKNK